MAKIWKDETSFLDKSDGTPVTVFVTYYALYCDKCGSFHLKKRSENGCWIDAFFWGLLGTGGLIMFLAFAVSFEVPKSLAALLCFGIPGLLIALVGLFGLIFVDSEKGNDFYVKCLSCGHEYKTYESITAQENPRNYQRKDIPSTAVTISEREYR